MVYVPSAAVVVTTPGPPFWFANTQTPPRSAPPTAAVTVPEIEPVVAALACATPSVMKPPPMTTATVAITPRCFEVPLLPTKSRPLEGRKATSVLRRRHLKTFISPPFLQPPLSKLKTRLERHLNIHLMVGIFSQMTTRNKCLWCFTVTCPGPEMVIARKGSVAGRTRAQVERAAG